MYSYFRKHTDITIDSFVWLFIGLTIIWLFWSASILGIEIGDGYLTIATSRYFLGLNENYGFQRGPFLSLYLLPAEWLSNKFNLHPLDVRIHHLFTAFLHSSYLIFTWRLLKTYYRDFNFFVALAFMASIPSFIFFSYAAFISPDIFPGLILICMILLVVKFEKKPDYSTWLYLILLGFMVVMIKQTYAIFWVSILVACWFYFPRKTNIKLFAAASISAILTWLAYSWYLQNAMPSGTPWLMSPIKQYIFIKEQYSKTNNSDLSQIFVWWLYLRNFYNYGILTSVLILPAIAYSLIYLKSKNKTIQLMSATWLVCYAFMQTIAFKEVRYLEFLAPLSAFILVPFLKYTYVSKYRYIFILMIIASTVFDFSRSTREALRFNNNFYSKMLINYFKPLDKAYANATFFNKNKPRITMVNHAGFTPNIFSSLKGDRFHRTFHLAKSVIPLLYDFNNIDYSSFTNGDTLSYEFFTPGDVLFFTNLNPLRQPPWDNLNRAKLSENYIQIVGIAESMILTRKKSAYHLINPDNESRPVLLLNNKDNKFIGLHGQSIFTTEQLSNILGKSLTLQDTIELIGFRISRLCNNNGCFDMDKQGQPMY